MKILRSLLAQLEAQPAAYAVTGLGAVGALIIAFAHLTTAEAAVLSGALTAIGTIITACYARPVDFTAIAGAAAILLQSLTMFNIHMTSGEIAALVGTVNFVLGIIAVPTVAEPLTKIRAREAAAAPVMLTASVGQVPVDVDQLARQLAVKLNSVRPW